MEEPTIPPTSTPVAVTGNLIGNTERPSLTGQVVQVFSPRTGEVLGAVPDSDIEDVAVAAQEGLAAAATWCSTPIRERTAPLHRFRQLVQSQLEELASLISIESGKTLQEGQEELLKGIEVVDYALSLQNLRRGGTVEVSRGVFCESRLRPLGLVSGVTPFNFPALVPMWMFPIAITLGNTFILKPSDRAPLTAAKLGTLMAQAGYPPGVFSVVHGGPVAVQALLDQPDIAAVGFVGSTRVARQVYGRATQHGKRVLCLGGAKNPIILLPDADPELAIPGILSSFTSCAGQRCMAGSVLLAVGDCDGLLTALVAAAKRLELGRDMGAIIDQAALRRLEGAITEAVDSGAAKLSLDGRAVQVPQEYNRGHWLGPTILDFADPQRPCARQELFGPVLTIVRVPSLAAALEFERQGEYGNAVSIFTRDAAAAQQVRTRSHAGMVGINVGAPVPREPFSFGGTKSSRFGQGDITGEGGVALWTDLQKVTSKWHMD